MVHPLANDVLILVSLTNTLTLLRFTIDIVTTGQRFLVPLLLSLFRLIVINVIYRLAN